VAEITLEQVDAVRARTGVSFRRAYEALRRTDGDVVRAIVLVEEELDRGDLAERVRARGNELAWRLRQVLREAGALRVVVRRGDRRVVDIPAAAGALGAALLPGVAGLGVAAALVTRSTISVERRDEALR
jgi:hypothetical protein